MKRPLALLALIALSPGLGGCVAAIPLASAALIGESTLSRSGTKDEAQVALAPPPVPAAATEPPLAERVEPLKDRKSPGRGVEELAALDPKVKPPTAARPPQPSSSLSQPKSEPGLTPSSIGPATPAAPDTSADPVYDALFATVTRIAQRLPSSREKRYSAILKNTRSLSPERTECRIGKTAVLIDLDPANGLAPLDQGMGASPRLNRILDGLRAQDVAILWLSGRRAQETVDLRLALTASGLDPTHRDPLYLTRFVNESKATRRADAAREFCIVAVLGDAWNDFDAFFQDSGKPPSAAAFDGLIGDAWFLAPPPLDPKG